MSQLPDPAPISAGTLRQAISIFVKNAYPAGTLPPVIQQRVDPINALSESELVPEQFFEVMQKDPRLLALRLGQPMYPHMKLVIEPNPSGGYLLRADAHDTHLHAPPGSPDEKFLMMIRAANKELTEKIEAEWVSLGLPTFRHYLREQLEKRRQAK